MNADSPHSRQHEQGRTIAVATWLAAAAVVAAFALNLVLARGLGPSGKGAVDLSLATVNLAVLALVLGLPSGVTYVVARGGNQRQFLAGAMAISVAATLVAVMVLGVLSMTTLADAFLPAGTESPIVLMGIGVGILALATLTRSILVGSGRLRPAAALELSGRLLSLVIVTWLVAFATPGGDILGAILAAIIAGWLLTAMGNAAIVAGRSAGIGLRVSTLARFSGPSYLANLVQFANYRVDLFIVAIVLGLEGVGLYALAVSIAQLLWIPTQSAAQVVLPAVASETSAIPYAAVRRSILLSWMGAVLLAITAPVLLPAVFGSGFDGTIVPLLVLLPGISLFALVNVCAAYLGGRGKPRLNLHVAIVTLGVGLTLDLALIPIAGIAGAAMATTASYAVAALLSARYYRRESGESIWDFVPKVEDLNALARMLASYLRRAASVGREI